MWWHPKICQQTNKWTSDEVRFLTSLACPHATYQWAGGGWWFPDCLPAPLWGKTETCQQVLEIMRWNLEQTFMFLSRSLVIMLLISWLSSHIIMWPKNCLCLTAAALCAYYGSDSDTSLWRDACNNRLFEKLQEAYAACPNKHEPFFSVWICAAEVRVQY